MNELPPQSAIDEEFFGIVEKSGIIDPEMAEVFREIKATNELAQLGYIGPAERNSICFSLYRKLDKCGATVTASGSVYFIDPETKEFQQHFVEDERYIFCGIDFRPVFTVLTVDSSIKLRPHQLHMVDDHVTAAGIDRYVEGKELDRTVSYELGMKLRMLGGPNRGETVFVVPDEVIMNFDQPSVS